MAKDTGLLEHATRSGIVVDTASGKDTTGLEHATRYGLIIEQEVPAVGNWPLLKTSQLGKDLFRAGVN